MEKRQPPTREPDGRVQHALVGSGPGRVGPGERDPGEEEQQDAPRGLGVEEALEGAARAGRRLGGSAHAPHLSGHRRWGYDPFGVLRSSPRSSTSSSPRSPGRCSSPWRGLLWRRRRRRRPGSPARPARCSGSSRRSRWRTSSPGSPRPACDRRCGPRWSTTRPSCSAGASTPAASKGSGETELNAGRRPRRGRATSSSAPGAVRNLLLSAGGPDARRAGRGRLGRRRSTAASGVPADRVVLERESRNTRENAERSARIVEGAGLEDAAPRHQRHAHAPGRGHLPQGRARGGPPAGGPPLRDPRTGAGCRAWSRSSGAARALRELAGRLVYRAAGYAGS